MEQLVLFAVLGLGPGALIAGIALSLVLSYRGAGLINLAAGAMAMVGGYIFWSLRTGKLGPEFDTLPALLITLAGLVVLGGLVEIATISPLRTASPLAKLVGSLGVLLVIQATVLLIVGPEPQAQPKVFPATTITALNSFIPIDRFLLAGTVVVMAAALAGLYRFTRFGLATRAASESETFALLAGLSPSRLSMANTLLATVVAGGVGVLAASVTALDPTSLPLQVVPALAAVLMARFTSFWIACAAGLGLGILNSLIDYASTQAWFPTADSVSLPGFKELLVFLIIIITMYLRGAKLPGRGDLVEQRMPAVPRPGRSTFATVPLTAAAGLALVLLPFDYRQAMINSIIGIILALSLVIITGFVGQISVVQLGLAGVAGFTVSHLAFELGIGFPFGPILAVAAATGFGLATAVSALRVRGVSLAIVTLAAATALTQFGFANSIWGGGLTGSRVPEPKLFGLDLGPAAPWRGLDGNLPSPVFGFMALATAVFLCLLTVGIRRAHLGQRMLAVRSNERAAAAAGIDVRTVKLAAFGISSFVAGVAGVLYAYNFGSVSGSRFDVFTALGLIAFAYVGGITMVSGALLAGLLSVQGLIPFALDDWFGLSGNYFLLFGGVMLLFTLVRNPEGIAGAMAKTMSTLKSRTGSREQADGSGPTSVPVTSKASS